MPDPFHFELVSPERLMFSGEVEAVIVPGTEGQFTVLKDHAPLMTRLKPGIVEVDETATKKQRLFVRGGFADVAPSGLTILAELAMPVEEFDAAAIAAQIKDAEEDVADATTDEQKRLANEKLDQLRELKEALGI
ncbi:MAG: F0F1 ATP synthase subunit epsilon [Methylobacteriaceae bacterium]|nr:F0F1 ATP synthase subunit epsilon [Methylobacteriaceae bacterium]